MKPSLQFRLSQHLTLTPQLQQSIRLLQLSTVELNQEIDRLLMENPVLEREEARGGEHDAPAAPPRRAAAEHHAARAAEAAARRDRLVGRHRLELARLARDDEEDDDRNFGTPDDADAARAPAVAALADQP